MPDKYKNKYRIATTRLPHWDYGWNAAYFVTICTKNRQHFFGEITKTPVMQLSAVGKIAHQYWYEIPDHFSFVDLGEFTVMPNHTHGIIIINKPDDDGRPAVETPESGVSTADNNSKNGGKNDKWKSGTLGVIINQYKRIVTINARKINPDFAWQSRFHDHIIRDEKSFLKISEYIHYNHLKWHEDRYYA